MKSKSVTIGIYGATGFLGRNLIHYILEHTPYSVRAISRNPSSLHIKPQYRHRVDLYPADILNKSDVEKSLAGIEVAVYLIHMMTRKHDYDEYESRAAKIFGQSAKEHRLKRIVYMSGLGNKKDNLSRHLASRHKTGVILKKYVPTVIELRASMIIGTGSAAYEIMRKFIKRLPIQVMPKWAVTPTQPISLDDALQYLTHSITVPVPKSVIVDIGGPDVMTYKELIALYARHLGKQPAIMECMEKL